MMGGTEVAFSPQTVEKYRQKVVVPYDHARGVSFIGGRALFYAPDHFLRKPGDDDMAITGDVVAVYFEGIKLSYEEAEVLAYTPNHVVLEATIETRNTIYIPS